MVFFTCDGCGESVKKNGVVKHRSRCRNSGVFSCIDCSKAFHGNEYETHTKCITEGQKYHGEGMGASKGEAKQEAWIDQVQLAIASVSPTDKNLKDILTRIKDYPNIPRYNLANSNYYTKKEAKFLNFVSNSLGVRNKFMAKSAWDAIATAALANKPANQKVATNAKGDKVENGVVDKINLEKNVNEVVKTVEKKKKRSLEGGDDSNGTLSKKKKNKKSLEPCPENETSHLDEQNESAVEQTKNFKWKKHIKRLLKNGENNQLTYKALKTQIIELHLQNCHGEEKEVKKMLDIKLEELASVTVEENVDETSGKTKKIVTLIK